MRERRGVVEKADEMVDDLEGLEDRAKHDPGDVEMSRCSGSGGRGWYQRVSGVIRQETALCSRL